MTRFEQLKEKGAQYMATALCIAISERIDDCEYCPFTDRCDRGHNGVLDYLTEEVLDDA